MAFTSGDEDHHQQQEAIEHVLSFPIILSDRIRHTIHNTNSYKLECSVVENLVNQLSDLLRSFVRFTNTTPSFYDRPVLRVFANVTKTLIRALTLVRKCRRRNILLQFVSIAREFRKVFALIDASIGDMKWLISIFSGEGEESGGVVLSLPPIASNDPIIAWVWSYICSLYSNDLELKTEVANELCLLVNDNYRNKVIIAQEGGIPPLLKLLKEDSSNARFSAANTLFSLADDQDRARLITSANGVPIIVQSLTKAPIRVQISLAKLIARMAENDKVSQEAFARENVIRPLVTFLSFETIVGGDKHSSNEPFELKHELKTCCAKALLMLVRGNFVSSKILTDTKGLLILAKLIETESGELKTNCLLGVMEITSVAEMNPDLRQSAFKTNSPAAKAIVNQLLRLIHESESFDIKIPAIRSIGSLARIFPAKEIRVIGVLVKLLSHHNPEFGTESLIALGKFTCSENYLRTEHSKTIIEFDGVAPLMRLLRGTERTKYHALVLLCYLAMHAGNREALVQARVLTVLEGVDKSDVGQHSHLKDLVVQAIYHLNMYHAGVDPQRKSYSPRV